MVRAVPPQRLVRGQGERKGRTGPKLGRHLDAPSQEVRESLRDVEPQSRTAMPPRETGIHLGERPEETTHILGCDTRACIADREACLAPGGVIVTTAWHMSVTQAHAHFAFVRELYRVARKIDYDLPNLVDVAREPNWLGWQFESQD